MGSDLEMVSRMKQTLTQSRVLPWRTGQLYMGRANAYDMQRLHMVRSAHEPQKGHVAQSSENEPRAGRVEKSGAENSNSPISPEHKHL